jgi:hypothetical protein
MAIMCIKRKWIDMHGNKKYDKNGIAITTMQLSSLEPVYDVY